MKYNSRKVTMWLLESAEDGSIDWEWIARHAVWYMAEDDVIGMLDANCVEFPGDEDEDEEE